MHVSAVAQSYVAMATARRWAGAVNAEADGKTKGAALAMLCAYAGTIAMCARPRRPHACHSTAGTWVAEGTC